MKKKKKKPCGRLKNTPKPAWLGAWILPASVSKLRSLHWSPASGQERSPLLAQAGHFRDFFDALCRLPWTHLLSSLCPGQRSGWLGFTLCLCSRHLRGHGFPPATLCKPGRSGRTRPAPQDWGSCAHTALSKRNGTYPNSFGFR